MDSKQLEKVEYLFCRHCEGSITKEEMELLNSLMLENEYVQQKYFEFVKTEFVLNHSWTTIYLFINKLLIC